MARGGGDKGGNIAMGFMGFVMGFLVDYFGRVATREYTGTNVSDLDMLEMAVFMGTGVAGYLYPKNSWLIPMMSGALNGKLIATIFGPRILGRRYILTNLTAGGQLAGEALIQSEAGYQSPTHLDIGLPEQNRDEYDMRYQQARQLRYM